MNGLLEWTKAPFKLVKNLPVLYRPLPLYLQNMSLRCLVVDDDPLIGDLIKHFCSKTEQVSFCIHATTALDGLNLLSAGGLDLIFLDYHLPDMKGQDFLERLQSQIPVIMVTSEAEFAARSYEYDQVVDFLVKPIRFERFQKALERVMHLNKNPEKTTIIEDSIFVKDGSKLVRIYFDKLLFIKSEGNYSNFISETGQTLSLVTMKDLENRLPAEFIRVHRSYLVNSRKIQVINQDELIVQDKYIPIGEKYRPLLMKFVKAL